jgi:hypothetical protein
MNLEFLSKKKKKNQEIKEEDFQKFPFISGIMNIVLPKLSEENSGRKKDELCHVKESRVTLKI